MGRVQGVGFRMVTHRIAAFRPVAGYVRNEPDGTVKLVVEGATAEVDAFLKAIAVELADYIQQSYVMSSECAHAFNSFEIQY